MSRCCWRVGLWCGVGIVGSPSVVWRLSVYAKFRMAYMVAGVELYWGGVGLGVDGVQMLRVLVRWGIVL